jgi:hypothetical protein
MGRWGQLHLAGNVFQWTLDVAGGDLGCCINYVVPCTDCTYWLGVNYDMDLRGGYSGSTESDLLPSFRWIDNLMARSPTYGVRCARPP